MTGDDEEPENDAPATDDEAPVDNAASRKAYARKVTALEQRQRESQAFWEAVFATPLGRREMWAILDRAHGSVVSLPCQCVPTGLFRLSGTATFRLTEPSGTPMWVLDASGPDARIVAIPPGAPPAPSAANNGGQQ